MRLWVDRSFTIRGSGTVVTGTLDAGTLRVGDELTLLAGGAERGGVRVRGLQSLGAREVAVPAVARVAVNLRGVEKEEVARGDALATPGAAALTAAVDARLDLTGAGVDEFRLPPQAVLARGLRGGRRPDPAPRCLARQVGARPAAAAGGRRRGPAARPRRAPDRRPGDGARHGAACAARRGAARARAGELARLEAGGRPDGAALLRERGALRAAELRSTGAAEPAAPCGWGSGSSMPRRRRGWRSALGTAVGAQRPVRRAWSRVCRWRRRAPLLGVPDDASSVGLVAAPYAVRAGRVVDTRLAPELPAPVAAALEALRSDLEGAPFAAPAADRLAALGLGRREVAAAERAGAVLRVADGVVLLAGADREAAGVLAGLPQPFTTSEARQALGTSRRVIVSAARAARPSRPDPTPARRPPHDGRCLRPPPVDHASRVDQHPVDHRVGSPGA